MPKFNVTLKAVLTVEVDHMAITDSVSAMRFAETNAVADGFVPVWQAVDVEETQ